VTVLIRILCIVFGVKSVTNFGKGLKNFEYLRGGRESIEYLQEETEVPFLLNEPQLDIYSVETDNNNNNNNNHELNKQTN
jgi:hypothetical protein